MRIFITGASGFIGSAATTELVAAGHQVDALARSEAAAVALTEAGAKPVHGSLHDLNSLQDAAEAADAVLHLAISRGDGVELSDALETDRTALRTLGSALAGSGRPLVFASATSMIEPGRLITEANVGDLTEATSRGRAEGAVLDWVDRDVAAVAVRFPTLVHGDGDRHGFLPMLMAVARERGVSAYVGDGQNRWPGVHRSDAAELLRLALQMAPAGARLHAVAEEGIAFREIALVIADRLRVPVESIPAERAPTHFDRLGAGLAALPAADIPASSNVTRELLSWKPSGPGVLADLRSPVYPAF